MSLDNYLNCATCHLNGGQDGWFWDFTTSGEGVHNSITLRGGSTTLVRLHWTGSFDEIQDFEHDIRSLLEFRSKKGIDEYKGTVRDPPLKRLSRTDKHPSISNGLLYQLY